jgi:multiple sugar transport system permease protein
MVLLLAGLRGIPQELHDAASVDGAGAWRRFRHITIPLLRPALFAVLVLGLIYTFRVFDLIWVMTRGGPVDATQVLPTYAFELVFQQFRFGQGAAAVNVLFVALFVFSLVYLRTLRREEAPA